MEQEAFIKLLYDLVNGKDKQQRDEQEKLYYALRAKDPSDEYLNLMVGAIQSSDDSVSYLATKLLIKDIR